MQLRRNDLKQRNGKNPPSTSIWRIYFVSLHISWALSDFQSWQKQEVSVTSRPCILLLNKKKQEVAVAKEISMGALTAEIRTSHVHASLK